MEKKFAIVVVGYNRAGSVERLLNSLDKVDFMGEEVTLITSIDFSGDNSVKELCENFNWRHGEKIVRAFAKKQGLRNHILSCGDFTSEYDAVAVLEDDLLVSPMLYRYMKASVEKYGDNDKIGGISLYSFRHNPNVYMSKFEPQRSDCDGYFLKVAQSWGEIWTKRNWDAFKAWYENNKEFNKNIDVPHLYYTWKESSWLKYYTKFLVETDRYFFYPYVGLTTNFSDIGTHCKAVFNDMQTALQYGDKEYKLPEFTEDAVTYDVFFERMGLGKYLGVPDDELCTDLYAARGNERKKRYWLTTRILDYKILNSYRLALKPQEMNIILDIKGDEIFLYDTSVIEKNPNKHNDFIKRTFYYRGIPGRREVFKILLFLYGEMIVRKFREIFRIK